MQHSESPVDYAERLALEKARAGREVQAADGHLPVLGADTIVVAPGVVVEVAQAVAVVVVKNRNCALNVRRAPESVRIRVKSNKGPGHKVPVGR